MKAPYKQSLVCRMCSYDANLPTASYCEICQQSLKSDRYSLPLLPLAGALVALLLAGGFYFLSKQINSPTSNNQISSPVTTAAPESPIASPINTLATESPHATTSPVAASEFQYYNSMSEVKNVPDGLFNYGGSIVFAALTAKGMNEAISQAHPQFRLRYVEPSNGNPGSRAGVNLLLNGELSFAHTSSPLKDDDYDKANKRGVSLDQVPVAIDGIVFFTNPQLPVQGLSIDQLQAIYTGKLTNWQQVGGSNLPIVAIALNPKLTSAINILLDGLANKNLGSKVQIVRDYTASIRKVAATPGSISYASAASIMNQKSIRPLPIAKAKSNQYVEPYSDGHINTQAFRDSSYPLTRQLFVVLSHKGKPEYQAGVAYTNLLLSKEGQKIIEQAGFVPLR